MHSIAKVGVRSRRFFHGDRSNPVFDHSHVRKWHDEVRRVVYDKDPEPCKAMFAELEPRIRRFGYSFDDWSRADVLQEFSDNYLRLD